MIFKNQLVKKFLKAFVSGGLVSIIAALALGVKISSLEDVKGLAILLATAFVSGGIHAIYELISPTVGADIQSITTVVTPAEPPSTVTTTVTPTSP